MVHPLAEFLRDRRAAVQPDDHETAATERRRVPGLRRDEVADRAGVSTDYYTRLEQGRVTSPSTSVLDGLARALHLDAAERDHLTDLAALPRSQRSSHSRPGHRSVGTEAVPTRSSSPLRPGLQAVLDAMPASPALVIDALTTVLAWNRAAVTVIADFGAIPAAQRSLARLIFLDPIAAARHADWDTVVRDVTGTLRMAAGRQPNDPALTTLVEELRTRSDPFRRLWDRHHVHQKTHGAKTFQHPRAGGIDLHYETFTITDAPDLKLVVFAASPGSTGHDLLTLLDAEHLKPVTPTPNAGGTDSPPNSTGQA